MVMKEFGTAYPTPDMRETCYRDFKFGRFVVRSLGRFHNQDWGELPPDRLELLNDAFRNNEMVLGSYTYADEGNLFAIWIMREIGTYNRKWTTVLFPYEY